MKILSFANGNSEYIVLLDNDDKYYDEPDEYTIPGQGYMLVGTMEFESPDVDFVIAGLPTSTALHRSK